MVSRRMWRCPMGGIPLHVAPFTQIVDGIAEDVHQQVPRAVYFINANNVACAVQRPDYAALFATPYARPVSDGMPLVWAGRRAYRMDARQWQRVYGPDVMAAVLASERSTRHYLLGGTPETLTALQATIALRWPAARIVGADSPPFRPLSSQERQALIERIRQSGAQVVWVGLGSPKQDWWVDEIVRQTGLVALGVGAAFDFLAGTKPQAPQWMRHHGLEWVFRLAQEPRRLGRRYLVGNAVFLKTLAEQPGLRRGAGLSS